MEPASLPEDSLLPWILILGSSLASVLGATVVFADALVRKFTANVNFSLADNKAFISSILALSSGILFYSSQFLLLPEALEEIQKADCFLNHPYLFLGLFYIVGIFFTLLLNKIIAFVAPSAIACPCSHEEDTSGTICLSPEPISSENHQHSHNHTHDHNHLKQTNSPPGNGSPSCSNERTALLSESLPLVINYGSTQSPKTINTLPESSQFISGPFFSEAASECECKFAPSKPVSLEEVWGEIPIKDMKRFSHVSCSSPLKSSSCITVNEAPPVILTIKPRDVEEHNIMWSVGIQTAVAVGLHKLPEGLITVIGAGSSKSLGLSLFIGIACHNFPEGFMLAVPIYAATGSSLKAFGFASLIGGLTQPLGGLIGLALLDHVNDSHLAIVNSVIFPLVAGIMLAVIVQSFIPAIRRQLSDSSPLPPVFCFFFGVGIMSALTSFFGHV